MSLRIAKFHSKGCSKKSERDFSCLCPFTVIGPDLRLGRGRFKMALGHRDQRKATAEMLEIEGDLMAGKDPRQGEPAGLSVKTAIEKFLSTKTVSPSRLRDLEHTLGAMETFLAVRSKRTVHEVRKPDLDAFVAAGRNAIATRLKERQMVGEFWRYLTIADLIPKSPAAGLINVGTKRDRQMARRKVMTFTPEQMQAILREADVEEVLNKHYLGQNKSIGPKTRAFIYVLAYSALSRIDATTLSPEHIKYEGGPMATIVKDRIKTGQTAHTSIPAFVFAMLNSFERESGKYYFWSGEGQAVHRATKWWKRTRAVIHAAGVPNGKPHMFRHTKVRDMYMLGIDVRIIADTLGDSIQTVINHYSSFDGLRQQNALDAQTKVAMADPNYQRLSQVDGTSVM